MNPDDIFEEAIAKRRELERFLERQDKAEADAAKVREDARRERAPVSVGNGRVFKP